MLGTAASIGSWLEFLQGRWLSDTKVVKRWMAQLPEQYHHKANDLFHRRGLYALLVAVLSVLYVHYYQLWPVYLNYNNVASNYLTGLVASYGSVLLSH